MKSYIKDYPRPQFVRESFINLNGTWDFSFDDENIGDAKKWHNYFPQATTINVPFTYETTLSGIADETAHDTIWYHKTVTIDETQLNDNTAILHFEGSDYRTKVWVNGNVVGQHQGGYARFSFDIGNELVVGENHITVKVEDSQDEQQPRGKQRWLDNNYACWYVQTTGIWKTVWIETVPKIRLDSVKITPNWRDKSIDIDAFTNIDVKNKNVSVKIDITFKDIAVNSVTVPIHFKSAKTTVDLYNTAVHEWGIMAWEPGNPNLYDVTFTLLIDDISNDKVLSYFGMREIEIMGDKIFINEHPLYQRLILDQGYWKDSHLTPPSEEALIEDIDKVMALGYNGLRKHQKTEDERFLYWCDIKGLLVWSEVPAAYKFTDAAIANFTNEWMEIVKQNYNHPSIITWTPFNESWGIGAIKTDKAQQQFTEAIYYLTKTYDKKRPVILNDGWEHTISDILTLHDYEELGDILYARYTDHKDDILNNTMCHNDSRTPFANGYTYRGQPVIISEFGGIAISNEGDGWGYGNKVTGEAGFLKRFDSITTAIKKLPYVCGYCYTQVTDVQQEMNGLMDMDRNFKVNPQAIKEINERNV